MSCLQCRNLVLSPLIQAFVDLSCRITNLHIRARFLARRTELFVSRESKARQNAEYQSTFSPPVFLVSWCRSLQNNDSSNGQWWCHHSYAINLCRQASPVKWIVKVTLFPLFFPGDFLPFCLHILFQVDGTHTFVSHKILVFVLFRNIHIHQPHRLPVTMLHPPLYHKNLQYLQKKITTPNFIFLCALEPFRRVQAPFQTIIPRLIWCTLELAVRNVLVQWLQAVFSRLFLLLGQKIILCWNQMVHQICTHDIFVLRIVISHLNFSNFYGQLPWLHGTNNFHLHRYQLSAFPFAPRARSNHEYYYTSSTLGCCGKLLPMFLFRLWIFLHSSLSLAWWKRLRKPLVWALHSLHTQLLCTTSPLWCTRNGPTYISSLSQNRTLPKIPSLHFSLPILH